MEAWDIAIQGGHRVVAVHWVFWAVTLPLWTILIGFVWGQADHKKAISWLLLVGVGAAILLLLVTGRPLKLGPCGLLGWGGGPTLIVLPGLLLLVAWIFPGKADDKALAWIFRAVGGAAVLVTIALCTAGGSPPRWFTSLQWFSIMGFWFGAAEPEIRNSTWFQNRTGYRLLVRILGLAALILS